MTTTDNYGFNMPVGSDSMSDPTVINHPFETFESKANIPVIAAGAALPQSGDYEIGDRVFRDDPYVSSESHPSNYILVCKDDNWGWHWRPIQALMSPWISLPSTIIDDANYEMHPTYPFQMAMDSRGRCWWRGAIHKITAGIFPETTYTIFKYIPEGIRPAFPSMYSASLSPVQSGTGKAGFVAGRIYLRNDGYNSFRFFNSDNGISDTIWLEGIMYSAANSWYVNG